MPVSADGYSSLPNTDSGVKGLSGCVSSHADFNGLLQWDFQWEYGFGIRSNLVQMPLL